ncbi:hypothetical protein [Niveibacterium sp. COAC-50]|uniref:hypothetical protein n=1 Tax=Niveibacterium sp. COAC-50 TaxID=2729384 RepID=UPI0015576A3D|nr:hypothetical protein [Niveibacterium sp. COAC-50]
MSRPRRQILRVVLPTTPRNPLIAPLMRTPPRIHGRTHKALRRADRIALKKQINHRDA